MPFDVQVIVSDSIKEALRYVGGDQLIFLNGDDWYSHDYVSTLQSSLSDHDLVGTSKSIEYDHRRRCFRRMHNEEPLIWTTGAAGCAIQWLYDAEEPWRIWEYFHGWNQLIPGSDKKLYHIRQREFLGGSTDPHKTMWRTWTKRNPWR